MELATKNRIFGFAFVCVVILSLACLIIPPILGVCTAVNRTERANNLKQIILAMHGYHEKHKSFPPAAIRDKNGKPLLSWRVAILPFLKQEDLYDQFRLDEPRDSTHNKTLLAKMPTVFRMPSHRAPATHTHHQILVGPGTAFERDGIKMMDDFPDGTSQTIMVVEARDAVPWTKPQDLIYDPAKPLPAFYYDPKDMTWLVRQMPGSTDRGFVAGMASGSILYESFPLDEKRIRNLIRRNSGVSAR